MCNNKVIKKTEEITTLQTYIQTYITSLVQWVKFFTQIHNGLIY